MNIVTRLTDFLTEIGIEYSFSTLTQQTFLPGIRLHSGTLIIDPEKLLYPGDILHEAGHLAVVPIEIRRSMSDELNNDTVHQGGELAAIAWSYAACIYLNIDPRVVFHDHGYKGGGASLAREFSEGRYFGVPLLQWQEMCYEQGNSPEGVLPYPHMIHWLCPVNRYAGQGESA